MYLAVLTVIFSGFLHSLWNVCAKKSLSKESFLFIVQIISFIVLAPVCFNNIINASYSPLKIMVIIMSMATHGLYFLLLARLYTTTDLSQSYPIIRGSSLLITPLFGVMFLNENISLIGWIGICIIISGIFFISELKLATANYKNLILSLCVGAAIGLYIFVDKITLKYMDNISLNQFGTLGNLIVLLPLVMKDKFKLVIEECRQNYNAVVIGSILAPSSYILFLQAINNHAISVLAPMREIGTVFGAIIGVFFLKEASGKRRIIASFIITGGIILLGLFH